MVTEKKKYQLTEQGKKDLEERLDYLKNVARPQNIIAIQDARSQGDLSENADYSAAREEQGKIESEIARIEDILQHCTIIQAKDSTDQITLGKTVRLNLNGKEREYSIVSTIEVDPKAGKISNESPLGAALMGLKTGDQGSFKSEAGKENNFEVLEVINN